MIRDWDLTIDLWQRETAEQRWGVFDVCVVEVQEALPCADSNDQWMLHSIQQFQLLQRQQLESLYATGLRCHSADSG